MSTLLEDAISFHVVTGLLEEAPIESCFRYLGDVIPTIHSRFDTTIAPTVSLPTRPVTSEFAVTPQPPRSGAVCSASPGVAVTRTSITAVRCERTVLWTIVCCFCRRLPVESPDHTSLVPGRPVNNLLISAT